MVWLPAYRLQWLLHPCLPLQVAFFSNKSSQGADRRTLRYTVVVTADLSSPHLTSEQRQAVMELTNNNDGLHRTVIGATMAQTHNFLNALKVELGM